MQRRVLGRRAAVARHEVQAQHRHVELVAAGVFEQQELGRHAFDVERRQAAVAADAVVLVDDGRADLQVGELADDGFGIARAAFALPLPRPLHAEIRGRDDAQPARREAEAVVNLGDRDAERCVAGEELAPGRVDVRLVAAAAQQLEQHLAMARRRRREQRSLALLGAEPAVDAVVGGGDAGRERMRDAGVVVLAAKHAASASASAASRCARAARRARRTPDAGCRIGRSMSPCSCS